MTLTKPITVKTIKFKGIPYNHCKLVNGNREEVSYIPKRLAVIGEILKVKQPDGSWEEGWVVKSVGIEVDESFIDVMRSCLMHQREVSDC
jgi:hypothetical protein